jgi:DNA uptake protein ComE-like DNA-binding protein
MKGHVGMFVLGAGLATAGALVYDIVRRGEIDAGEIGERIQGASREVAREASHLKNEVVGLASAAMMDINEASREDLRGLGIDDALLDRVIEGRPYRNKLDLLSRMILPQELYDSIKEHIDISRPDESVKVA